MHIFALRLRARMPLVLCVCCAKRSVKKDHFLAVISAETKPSLSALLPFSHQSHLLAAVIQPLLLANSTQIPCCDRRRLVCACGDMLAFASSTITAHLLHAQGFACARWHLFLNVDIFAELSIWKITLAWPKFDCVADLR